MRDSVAVAAAIRDEREGRTWWLARWSQTWKRFHLVGGHKTAEESYRDCLIRQLGEELGLGYCADFAIDEQPCAHVEFVAWSEETKDDRSYATELFEVRLRGIEGRERVDADPANRWLSEDEIRSNRCADGRLVSPTVELLLSKIHWGRPD